MRWMLTHRFARALVGVLVLALVVPLFAGAQQSAGAKSFKPEELDQLAAPIALYADPLLAQVLMASTYPLEVVQAARFVKDNPNLKGEQLNEALKKQTWDDSVKSLVTFPQVLAMMNDKLDWTQKLGDAFLAQQKELMDAVQQLRAKARAEGVLTTTKEQKVTVEPVTPTAPAPAPPASQPAQQTTVIKIEPTNPQVIYVPTYNPTVVYGAWPYPAYPPYYYYPPGYVAGAAFFSFAAGVAVGSALWGNCNWHGGDVDINVNNYNNFTKNVNTANISQKRTELQSKRQGWQHNPENRKGVQYRDQATQQRFNKTGVPNAQAREAYRGRAEQGRQEIARGGAEQFRQGRPGDRGAGVGRQGGDFGGRRGAGIQQTRGGGAFEGMGRGSETRSFSSRGSASRQSAGGAGGRAGGGSGSRGGGGRGGGGRGGGGGRR